jgi:hypothetical protein
VLRGVLKYFRLSAQWKSLGTTDLGLQKDPSLRDLMALKEGIDNFCDGDNEAQSLKA